MLSTIDNPINPFDDFVSWFLFDIEKGHNCSGLLARFANFDDKMTQNESDIECERAIDQIIENDPLGLYIKVTNNK